MDVSEVCGRLLPAVVRPTARRQLVRYRYFGLRSSDGLLVSYPASGSTWLRFLLAHALTGEEPDFDSIRTTVPPVGRHRSAPALLAGGGRLVRTHEPLGSHAGRAGQPVVYLVRDGRTVALSYLDHLRREGRYQGDLAEFLERFVQGRLDGYGSWAAHVLSALEFGRAASARFLLLRYEDLHAHPEAELSRVLAFLGREVDHVVLATIVRAHTKERMRAKEATSRFLVRRHSDGTPVIRPDRLLGFAEQVPADVRARFERACGAALEAAGYTR